MLRTTLIHPLSPPTQPCSAQNASCPQGCSGDSSGWFLYQGYSQKWEILPVLRSLCSSLAGVKGVYNKDESGPLTIHVYDQERP